MKRLYLYTIFHANLSFSSIPKDQYSFVIDNCYWPLLELLDELDIRLGFEFSSLTLETILKVDPSFIERLKEYWEKGKCEIIGSSFTQSIFPLIPSNVNIKNLYFGNSDYINILGKMPETAFLNEMTYSPGLISLYLKAGYKNIIMDWDNATEYNLYPIQYKYRPNILLGQHGERINLIWNSSLTSFKFQRYIHGRIKFTDYLKSIHELYCGEEDRTFILYGTDWELIGYRPGIKRVIPEEFQRMRHLFSYISNEDIFKLVTPKEVLELFPPKEEIRIDSPECPIPCKNRDYYNVTRWAVSGRDDVKINTQCYELYQGIKSLEQLKQIFNDGSNLNELWRDLNFLFSSDFRTDTIDEKYIDFRNRMGDSLARYKSIKEDIIKKHVEVKKDFLLINTSGNDWIDEPYSFDMRFQKGRFKKNLICLLDGEVVPTQLEEKEYYKDGSLRKARVVVLLRIRPGEIKQGEFIEKEGTDYKKDVKIDLKGDILTINTPSVYLRLSQETGGDIRRLVFPDISKEILIGYLTPLYYDHIAHSNDYYSGGFVLRDIKGVEFNDTHRTIFNTPQDTLEDYPIRIPIECEIFILPGRFLKRYYVYTEIPRFDLVYQFYLNDIHPMIFRIGIITFNPRVFNKETLRYSVVNGGETFETYFTYNKTIKQNIAANFDVSCMNCLGATEGWVDISDKRHGITIVTNKKELYSVPLIEYEEIRDTYLLRVYHSIGELDDTGSTFWRGHNSISFSLLGHNNSLDSTRRQAQNINAGLTVVRRYEE